MVKYNLNPRSGSLKDNDLFRRFFVCMNYEYGIVDGYDSNEIVHLSYFDASPIELRYYMFGR